MNNQRGPSMTPDDPGLDPGLDPLTEAVMRALDRLTGFDPGVTSDDDIAAAFRESLRTNGYGIVAVDAIDAARRAWDGLLTELSESPLPGARYAYEVAKRRQETAKGPQTFGDLSVDKLRRAIGIVSVRHDWEHTTDREDRTEEIAVEYALQP